MTGNTTTESGRHDWLAALLLRQHGRFGTRLLAALARWRATPRQLRRRVQRRAALTAAGAALALALAAPLLPTAHAASITVSPGNGGIFDNGLCQLSEAILNANDNTTGLVHDDCAPGTPNGPDTLTLVGDVTLTDSQGNFFYADTGLPLVTSEVTIDGAGYAITRDGAATPFRIMAVSSSGDLTLERVAISGGEIGYAPGGGIASYGTLSVNDSTISDNYAYWRGGGIFSYVSLTLTNSTVSGNSTDLFGGGIRGYGDITITNSTISGNSAGTGGGVRWNGNLAPGNLEIRRSVVSGNSSTGADEINAISGTVIADDHNVIGHSGQSNADAFSGFTLGASDVTATSDGSDPTALADILDTTLADNGGPTPTHNLVPGSPALDLAPDADCLAAPVNGLDQRGATRPFDVAGEGNDGADTCDAGAVEADSLARPVLVSTSAAGTVAGVDFGPHDILLWDGSAWSKWFDGTAAGLTPNGRAKHNVNAIHVDDTGAPYVFISFAHNARRVPGIFEKVDGMDIVVWDGSSFSLVFDGQDVGLTSKSQEKIDALHILDGPVAPPALIAAAGGSCQVYMLVSTQGPGRVTNYDGTPLRFGGEDVLGFCFTSNGDNTAGKWIKVLDGSDAGLPRNSLSGLSAEDDGQTLYLTVNRAVNLDGHAGGHSMVFSYDMTTGAFDGPLFSAADEGLTKFVDAIDY